MTVLRIEHAVSSFDAWKQAFDSDPSGRARMRGSMWAAAAVAVLLLMFPDWAWLLAHHL